MPKLPPGPRSGFLQSIRYVQDAYRFYADLQARYGDPFTIPTLNGTVVATGHPEGVKQIFAAPPDTFKEWRVGAIEPMLGPGSVFLQSGDTHASRRKLMMPLFHGDRMHTYGELFREITLRHAARLPQGETVSMEALAKAITLEAIVRAVFGISDPVEVERWSQVVAEFVEVASAARLAMFLPFLRHEFGGIGPWARFVKVRRKWDAMISEEITRRRARPGGEDIMSMLVAARFEDGSAMSDAELRDQLVSLLVAGHETTALVMTWAFYWLGRHPEAVAKLREELAPYGDAPDPMTIARLPYLDAFVHEVLRLNPILPDVPRWLCKPLTLRGYELPAGMAVAAVTVLVHHNPELYPEPLTFRPERFLEQPPTPFTFFAFGGGSRRCLGAAFATYELKVVVATLAWHYDLLGANPELPRIVRRNMTLGPAGGVPMALAGRAP